MMEPMSGDILSAEGIVDDSSATATGPARERVIALDVEGMMCQKNCGSTVKAAIEAVPGVSRAGVSFAARRAWAWLPPAPSPPDGARGAADTAIMIARVVEAVEDVGFGAEASPDVELLVEGMMCQKNCGTTVKNALLASSPAVLRAEASFKEGRARVWVRPAATAAPATSLSTAGAGGDGSAVVIGEDISGGASPAAAAAAPIGADFLSLEAQRMVESLEAVGFDASVAPAAVLEIEGMMCQKSCGATVQACLASAAPEVERAEVSYAEGRLARVWRRLDGPRLPVSVLVGAVEDVGFGARVVGPGEKKEASPAAAATATATATAAVGGAEDASLPKMLLGKDGGSGGGGGNEGAAAIGVFSVSGMSCAACVGNVESFVSALDGVEDVRIALLAEKAEVRFDPDVTNGQALADGITGLGYPSRHLSSTVLSGDGDADGKGDVTLEVLGVAGPECVSKLEAAVSALSGIASCTITRLPPTNPGASGDAFGGDGTTSGFLNSHGAPLYNLVAKRTPAAATAAQQQLRHAAANASPMGRFQAKPSPGVGGGGTSPSAAGAGGRGGGGSASFGSGSAGGGGDDAVWEALQAAYDATGRRRHSGVREVLEAVRGLGYGARVVSNGGGGSDASAMEASQAAEVAEWRRLLLVAVGLTVPVMILHMMDHADGEGPDSLCGGEASYGTLLSWVLVTIVQAVVGKRFYRNAYKAAQHWSFGMDMLVVVGTSVSYLYSSLALLLACTLPGEQGDRPHLFLESPAMLLSFIALGKFLEVLAKRKTSQALVILLKAQPHGALLVEPGGDGSAKSPAPEERLRQAEEAVKGGRDAEGSAGEWALKRARGWRERSVEASLVQPGDVLKVLPGSQFPTDGTLLSGQTYVDESMITGESSPVAKREGDPVCGGTANQHGSVLMRAERVGEETMLAQLCRLVEEAQMSKAPIQRQADRVAGVFVPAVISASVVTFLGWFIAGEAGFVPQDWLAEERSDAFLFALLFGVSVVVVACPCALGLATPTAVMVGTGVGAGNGVLIKGGAALEAAHRVNTVVFDKTGTLTRGKPFLTDVVPVPSPALDRLVASSPGGAGGAARVAPQATSTAPGTDARTDGASTAAAAAAAVLALAAACEAYSEHPVGRAMVDAAAAAADDAAAAAAASKGKGHGGNSTADQHQHQRRQEPLSTLPEVGASLENGGCMGTAAAADVVTEFVSEPGCGVACQHPLGRVCVGTRAWAESNGGKRNKVLLVGGENEKDSLQAADAIMRGLEEEGKTAVIVTVGGEAVGVVAVADTDKEGSRRAVMALERMGLDVWVVTGDNRRVAAALARRLGIPANRVMAEVLPAEKARKIQELQVAGGHVAMVGDGVNDAPALATANVGIAVGAGTQVAMEAADMVLVRSDVCDVVSALHLGRKVFGRIRLNFVFAMLYNLCGVPVAAGVLYPFLHIRLPPALAGLSMALSSISVVLSSLALRFYRKPEIDDDGRLWERSVAAVLLELISDGWDSIRHFSLWRRLSSLRGGRGWGATRFAAVGDDEFGGVELGRSDVERQPLGTRRSSSSSSSSGGGSGEIRWFAPAARTRGSATAGSANGPAASFARRGLAAGATATAGSYSLVRSHSRDNSAASFASGSGAGIGEATGAGVETIGFV